MKIVFVGCSVFKHGTFFRWHRLARELVALGHEVRVVASSLETRPRYSEQIIDGIPYHLVARASGGRLFAGAHFNLFSAAKRLVTPVRLQPDIVHLFEPLPTIAATWLSTRSFRRATTVWDWCDLWYGGLLDPKSRRLSVRHVALWAHYLENWFPRKCDWVTAISHDLERRAQHAGARGVSYLPNGMEIDPVDRSSARTHFQLSDDLFYLVFAGRTTSELKWCFTALRRMVRQSQRRVHLMLAGMPAEECETLGGDIAAHWTHLGQVSAADCRLLYGACDLGLLPLSDNDFNRSRLPLKLLDMIGAGCPVLASGVGDVAELATQLPGIALTGADEESFAGQADLVVRDSERVTRDLRARSAELTSWTWAHRARDLERLYSRLIAASPAHERFPQVS